MAIGFQDFIYNCYSSRSSVLVDFVGNSYMELNKGMPFNKFMKIPLTENTIEVPCIYKYYIMRELKRNITTPNDKADVLYIPLLATKEDTVQAKSSNSILKLFLYSTPGHINLAKKKGGDTTYLGGEGLILYEDYTPIVMLTLELERSQVDTHKFVPKRQIIRVNPIVYSKNDILAKYIRTKFLEGAFKMELNKEQLEEISRFSYYRTSRYKLRDFCDILTTKVIPYKFKVIIDDFSDFFITPNIPDVNFNNDDINEMLIKENIFAPHDT